jgi:chromosome partitioning protein
MTISLDEWLSYQPKKPKAKSSVGPAKVLSIFNQKGGVGKTTSTISIGAALAEYGRKVLVVDFDPQGSLTVGLTGNHEISPSVYDLIVGGVTTQEVILKTRVPGLDLLPAGIDLAAAEAWLFNEVGREYALQRALTPVMNDYDYILIDCLPSLGLLAINALSVSQGLIIPLQCEFYALKGLALLQETLEKVQSRINPTLEVLGILPTRVGRSTHHRDVLELVIQGFGDVVFHTIIPDTIKISDSTMAAQPITSYASSSNAAEAYRHVAAELIERIEGKK